MKVNKYLLPGLVVLSLLVAVGVAQGAGYWIVSGKQMIDTGNLTSTADIRGWMTLEEVANAFALDLADLYTIAGIPADVPPGTALKEMEGVLADFETSSVRDAVAAFIGETTDGTLDSPPVPESADPDAGAKIVPDTAAAEPASITDDDPPASEHSDPAPDLQSDGSGSGPAPVLPGSVLAAADIKGSHTLVAIAEQTGVSLPDLLDALSLPPETDTTLALRELVGAGKIAEVTVVRTAVAELQGK